MSFYKGFPSRLIASGILKHTNESQTRELIIEYICIVLCISVNIREVEGASSRVALKTDSLRSFFFFYVDVNDESIRLSRLILHRSSRKWLQVSLIT
jgi:hypothetical protein